MAATITALRALGMSMLVLVAAGCGGGGDGDSPTALAVPDASAAAPAASSAPSAAALPGTPTTSTGPSSLAAPAGPAQAAVPGAAMPTLPAPNAPASGGPDPAVPSVHAATPPPVNDATAVTPTPTPSQATEFRVNTSTALTQTAPDVAGLRDGGFIVVWTTYESEDSEEVGVYARRFGADGTPLESDRTITTTRPPGFRFFDARVTALSDGGWLIGWIETARSDLRSTVQLVRVDSRGRPVGGPWVLQSGTYASLNYVIAGSSDGGFAVAATAYDAMDVDRIDCGLFVQRYGPDGAAQPRQRVTSVDTFTCEPQSLAALQDGSFVLAWHGWVRAAPAEGSVFGAYLRRFDAQGRPIDDAKLLGQQQFPAAVGLSGGGYALAWMEPVGGGFYLTTQRFGGDGSPSTPASRVDPVADLEQPPCPTAWFRPCEWPSQRSPTLAALRDGGWVVGFQSSERTAGLRQVFARRYDAQGAAVGAPVRVSANDAVPQSSPAAAGLAGGGFVLAWETGDDGDSLGVHARRFAADGLP
jgi:hypothetical protein